MNSLPNVECLLITAAGDTIASENWPESGVATETSESGTSEPTAKEPGLQEPAKAESDKALPATDHKMKIEFEISKPANSACYRRPYVAVRVEDKDGFPVKNRSLFLMADNPGPRWYRDLRRWYASDQLRSLVDEQQLIGTIFKTIRNPGKYKVAWDGRDDSGKLLKSALYTLYLESAREHVTYQWMKYEFEFGSKSFQKKLKGNVETKSASVNYVKK